MLCYYNLASWWWAQSCSKHVEDYNNKRIIQGYSKVPPWFRKLTAQQPRQTRQKEAYQWIENLSKFLSNLTAARSRELLISGGFWQTLLAHARQSQPMGPDGHFVSQRTGSHSAGISCTIHCFVCRWFCVVHDPKPPLHLHNWLSFGKFQDTERFLIHCERHFSSRLPPSGGACKYTKAPGTKKKKRKKKQQQQLGEILCLLICSLLPCLSWLLRSRVRKSRRDLWITLYNVIVHQVGHLPGDRSFYETVENGE